MFSLHRYAHHLRDDLHLVWTCVWSCWRNLTSDFLRYQIGWMQSWLIWLVTPILTGLGRSWFSHITWPVLYPFSYFTFTWSADSRSSEEKKCANSKRVLKCSQWAMRTNCFCEGISFNLRHLGEHSHPRTSTDGVGSIVELGAEE